MLRVFVKASRWLLPTALLLAAFALYLVTLAPGMLRGDSGEFQWAMASLNVAHATGYPLFTLFGYGWQLLPLANNIAWQLNLLAALFGALTVTTLFCFARSLTGNSVAALVGALFFALAPVVWFNASILEVYSLHAFLLTLLLYLLWLWARGDSTATANAIPSLSLPINQAATTASAIPPISDRDIRTPPQPGSSPTRHNDTWLYFAFFVLGLALAHHRLIVLALPAILYFLLATGHRFFLNLRRLVGCALVVLPGLVLYLYVPLRLLPEGFSLDFAVYDIILGREYATSLLRELHPLPVLVEIPLQNFHIGLAFALVGVVALYRYARHLDIALVLVYVVDVAFALIYDVPDVQVFLTSSFVVLALWIAAGTAFLLEWTGKRAGAAHARRAQVPLAIVLVLIPLLGLIHFREIEVQVAKEAAPEQRARAIGASDLPPGAMLEMDWETATALRFLQTTEKLRPDLDVRLIEMDKRDEFWRALNNAQAGRAVLVERGVKWTRAPAGFGVEPQANELAQIVQVPVEMHRDRAPINDRVELLGYLSTENAFTVYWRVNQPLNRDVATYVHYLDADGNKIAQDDRAACCEAVYGYRTSEWEAGQVYADVFKPAPAHVTSFVIGMYENVNGDIEPYGEELSISAKGN